MLYTTYFGVSGWEVLQYPSLTMLVQCWILAHAFASTRVIVNAIWYLRESMLRYQQHKDNTSNNAASKSSQWIAILPLLTHRTPYDLGIAMSSTLMIYVAYGTNAMTTYMIYLCGLTWVTCVLIDFKVPLMAELENARGTHAFSDIASVFK